jgi:hypothetical protein
MVPTPAVPFGGASLPAGLWLTSYPACDEAGWRARGLHATLPRAQPSAALRARLVAAAAGAGAGALPWDAADFTVQLIVACERRAALNLYFHGFLCPRGAARGEGGHTDHWVGLLSPTGALRHWARPAPRDPGRPPHPVGTPPPPDAPQASPPLVRAQNHHHAPGLGASAVEGVSLEDKLADLRLQMPEADEDFLLAMLVPDSEEAEVGVGLEFGRDTSGLVEFGGGEGAGAGLAVCVDDASAATGRLRVCLAALVVVGDEAQGRAACKALEGMAARGACAREALAALAGAAPAAAAALAAQPEPLLGCFLAPAA